MTVSVRAGAETVTHWAVEVPVGDYGSEATRLVQYQTRERPARMSAQQGGFRLLCRVARFGNDGSESYGPWRDAALAGLIEGPDISEPHPDRLYFIYRHDSTLPLLAGWRDLDAALQYAKDSNAEVVLGIDITYRNPVSPPPEEPRGTT